MAYDESADEYHIIEAKFKSSKGSVGKGWLDLPDKGRQMSDEWIEQTIQEMSQSDDPATRDLANDLDEARLTNDLQKEIIAVQNEAQNEKTIVDSLTEPGLQIDRVHIVKLEEVIE